MKPEILTVSEFVRELKLIVDHHPALRQVALVGELSNFKAHHSGHYYFSLKEKDTRVSCVMFRSKAALLKIKPKDGGKVVVVGSCQIFYNSGQIQIYVDRLALDGLGDYYIRYEELKTKFQKAGYFDEQHKKLFPKYPQQIAIICGEGSAAYADITRTLHERWPLARVIELLAYVQGELAVNDIVAKIEDANRLNVDAVILSRGGGSIEDLWAFNDERVIQAIFASTVPIVTGIGHESDVTLSDFVADYRSATPTHAAMFVTPNFAEESSNLKNYTKELIARMLRRLQAASQTLDFDVRRSHIEDPQAIIDIQAHRLNYIQTRLLRQESKLLDLKQSLAQFSLTFEHAFRQKMNASKATMRFSEQAITHRVQAHLNLKKSQFSDILKTVNYLSPLTIMARGYALTYQNETLIKSSKNLSADDEIMIRYNDGTVVAIIKERNDLDE